MALPRYALFLVFDLVFIINLALSWFSSHLSDEPKEKPEVPFNGVSGRIFMLFGVYRTAIKTNIFSSFIILHFQMFIHLDLLHQSVGKVEREGWTVKYGVCFVDDAVIRGRDNDDV